MQQFNLPSKTHKGDKCDLVPHTRKPVSARVRSDDLLVETKAKIGDHWGRF